MDVQYEFLARVYTGIEIPKTGLLVPALYSQSCIELHCPQSSRLENSIVLMTTVRFRLQVAFRGHMDD
jgi:hypothetical protein